MQDEPIRYSRSQCARLFGISMDTLRYYERIGLLHVARDKRSRQCVYTGRIIGKLVAQPSFRYPSFAPQLSRTMSEASRIMANDCRALSLEKISSRIALCAMSSG